MTLLELLIALVLVSLVVLGFTGLHSFSHYHVISSERRAKIQNEVSFCLAHMTKEISQAIGNERVDGARQVIDERDIGTDRAIRVYKDNNNGRRDPNDYWIAYRLTSTGQLQYCPQCTEGSCTTCTPNWGTVAENTLSTKIAITPPGFTVNKPQDASNFLTDNSVEITLTGRWQPGQGASVDNPEITMRNRIKMPSASNN